MTIPVYEQERIDDVAEAVASNNVIAYECELRHVDHNYMTLANVKRPDLVKINTEENWDLYPLDSTLVSVGWNKNDDVFDPAETWAARKTPVNKQVNYEHNEADIIGHIVDSVVVGFDGKTYSDSMPESPFDIVVASVLYRAWSDAELQARMDRIIAEIPQGKWFVSMECLFRNFDYAVITAEGNHGVIPRNADTAFLTKHLRVYGGTGEFQGLKLGRLLRGFTYSGKGLVERPANPRSVIFSEVHQFNAAANIIDSKAISEIEENSMSDVVANLQKQLDDALAELKDVKAAHQEQLEASVQAERERLEAKIAELEAQAKKYGDDKKKDDEDMKAKNAELEAVQATVTERDETIAELTKKIEAAEAEKLVAERISVLVEAGAEADAAKSIVDTWAEANDEQFAQVVELSKANFGKKDDDKKDDKKDDKSDASEDDNDDKADAADLDSAEADDDLDLGDDAKASNDDELQAAVASYLDSVLNGSSDED